MPKIQRAILSCHDKTGLVDFARFLREFDVELISTTGTLSVLAEAGVDAINIGDFTGVPEMLSGRVKSLHPRVHAGLLAIRDSKLHVEQMHANEFPWIDLVVVNPKPLSEIISRSGGNIDEVFEQTDIGGISMIRSGAKNFRYVTVAVNPQRYSTLMHEMRAHEGEVSFPTRFHLAQEAFSCTADYDRALADFLQRVESPAG